VKPTLFRQIILCIVFVLICIISSVPATIVLYDEPQLQIPMDVISQHDDNYQIAYPRSSCPVFVENGSTFIVDFSAPSVDTISAYIQTAYEPVVDVVWLSLDHLDHEQSEWTATFIVPEDTPLELYNLSIIIEDNSNIYQSSEPRSVNVIDSFKDNFSFIHIADLHIGDPRGFLVSIQETLGMKSIKKCIEEINLIHPDFILISGDLVFGQFTRFSYRREYRQCYELLQMFDVPTYIVPGNHDGYNRLFDDGFDYWEKYFGPLYYSFDYGSYHFTAVNSYDWSPLQRFTILFIPLNWGGSVREQQLNWIEEDLSEAHDQVSFMFLHHNPLWDTQRDSLLRNHYYNQEAMLRLIDDYNVDMVLAGHTHIDNVTIQNDTIFVTTTTPESSISVDDGYWGYRLVTITNGSVDSYTYKEPKYSIPSYCLNYSYDNSYIVTIENDLELSFKALVKFFVPIQDEFDVNLGEIVQIRSNGYFCEVYVLVDVESESEVTVEIQ